MSGINEGANIGIVSHYSGTIGAAMEGARNGLVAVAVSADARGGESPIAARFTARFVRKLQDEKVTPGIVYSINVPALPADTIPKVVCAHMGGSNFSVTGFKKQGEAAGKVTYVPTAARPANAAADNDTTAFLAGAITVTPLKFDWTDEDAITELKQWQLVAD